MNAERLRDCELDAFQEMGNIGTGSALTALSHLLNESIVGNRLRVMNLDCVQLIDCFGQPDESAMGILFPFYGDISGMLLLVFQKEFVIRLLREVLDVEVSMDGLDEELLAVIREFASIMASSYFTAVSAYTRMRINISFPAISVDMVGSMITDTASWIVQVGKESVCVDSSFSQEGSKGVSHVVLMLHEKSTHDFLRALEVET